MGHGRGGVARGDAGRGVASLFRTSVSCASSFAHSVFIVCIFIALIAASGATRAGGGLQWIGMERTWAGETGGMRVEMRR